MHLTKRLHFKKITSIDFLKHLMHECNISSQADIHCMAESIITQGATPHDRCSLQFVTNS